MSFVIAQAEFGFVPALLSQFRSLVQEGRVVDLAHYVHFLGETKSTVSASLCIWVNQMREISKKTVKFCKKKSLEYLIFSNFNGELANVSSPFD